VAQPVVRDGHLPRDAGAWSVDGHADERTHGPAGAALRGTGLARHEAALRLLPSPALIRVRLGRAGLEAFRHGGTWHDVTAWSGPERLAPRWWVEGGTDTAAHHADPADAPSAPADGARSGAIAGPRDYYSARTADGALWLLFRAGASRQWFVEGWWD